MIQLNLKQKIAFISLFIGVVLFGVWYLFFRQEKIDEIPYNKTLSESQIPENNDDIRIRHLTLLDKAIKESLARGVVLPLPENALQVNFEEVTMVYQGKAGRDLFDVLGLNDLVDPATGMRYDYAIAADKKTYQIVTTLDDVQRSNTLLEKAVFYSIGNNPELFIRDFAGNIVRREKVNSTRIDIATSSIRREIGIEPLRSCKEIYTFKSALTKPKSAVYTIDINGHDTKVFCDMQTDGGGWTLFYANNGYEDSPIQKSYVEMRDTMETDPLLDLSRYDEQYLVGLLNYKHFIQSEAREILIRNRTGDVKKWVKFTFSTSRSLEWALGPLVLGKTEYGCVSLPRRDMWSIINNDKTLSYDNLRQVMNHAGTSWGVSHEKYFCNGYEEGKNPHIGFYNADSSLFMNRARSNEGTGGTWGSDGDYRYFIR